MVNANAARIVSWTERHPFPPAAHVNALVNHRATLVALGDDGVILTHALPGGSWLEAESPAHNHLRAGQYAHGRFVAVGDEGTILISPDGARWEARVSGTDRHLQNLVLAGGWLYAMGQGGTLLRSPDGLNWERLETPATVTLRDAAYGNDLLVIVGDSGAVLTSREGHEWVQALAPVTDNLGTVAFGNGIFLARGSKQVITSSDGARWEPQQPQGADVNNQDVKVSKLLMGLSFGQGVFVVTGFGTVLPNVLGATPYTLPLLLTSADGFHWRDLSDALIDPNDPLSALGSVSFGNGAFVVPESHGGSRRGVLLSTNALDWVRAEVPMLEQVRFGDALFLGLGPETADPAIPNQVLVSPDGLSWELLSRVGPVDPLQNLWEVAFLNGRFVVAGDGINLVSRDGRHWEWRSGPAESNVHSMVGSHAGFVALSRTGALLRSEDGLEWITPTSEQEAGFAQVIAAGGQFVAVGRSGMVATSQDGRTWVRRESGTASNLAAVANDGETLVTVGDGGTVLQSHGGAVWEPRDSKTVRDLTGVAHGNGQWIVIGSGGLRLRSADGLVWSSTEGTWENLLPPLKFMSGRFLARCWPNGPVPTMLLVASTDGSDWQAPGGIEVGPTDISDFAALDTLTVALALPGNDFTPPYPPFPGRIWVNEWRDSKLTVTNTASSLRSVAYGRGTLVAVGDRGLVLQSNALNAILGASFLAETGECELEVTGFLGGVLRVQYSTDLVEWTDLQVFTNPQAPLRIRDASAGGAGARFYRALSPDP